MHDFNKIWHEKMQEFLDIFSSGGINMSKLLWKMYGKQTLEYKAIVFAKH